MSNSNWQIDFKIYDGITISTGGLSKNIYFFESPPFSSFFISFYPQILHSKFYPQREVVQTYQPFRTLDMVPASISLTNYYPHFVIILARAVEYAYFSY